MKVDVETLAEENDIITTTTTTTTISRSLNPTRQNKQTNKEMRQKRVTEREVRVEDERINHLTNIIELTC